MMIHNWLKSVFTGLLSMLLFTSVGLAQDATPPPLSPTFWAAPGAAITLPPVVQTGLAPVNGIKMFYATFGDPANPPLLLLHGGLGESDMWVNQIPDFASQYYIIVVDDPGQGRSTFGDQPFSTHLEATDVLAVLDDLKITSVDLLGWSDGGNIGLDIAVNHPERLSKLVLYGANYNSSGVIPMDQTCKLIDCDALFGKLVTEYTTLSSTPKNWDTFSTNYFQSEANDPNFTEAQLKRITVPTLVLDGLKEEIVYPDHAYKMATLIPTADLVMMNGVGHFAPVDKTGEFNHIVLDYLGR